MGVKVFASSLDGVGDLALFAGDQELNFRLLSDPDGSVAAKYGVLADGARFASRVTFVIDDQGILRAVDDGVKVETHGTDLVELVESLKK